MGILLFAAQTIVAYGFTKGLDKLFSNQEDFENRLHKIIEQTISEYKLKYLEEDVGKSFPFYKSQILIQELLKLRLFGNSGYVIDPETIQKELEQNPNIIKPKENEISYFFQIFDQNIKNDQELSKLKIETFYKEAIFDIYEKVEKITNSLDIQLIEIVPILEDEYKAEINEAIDKLKSLKPRTALSRLQMLEERMSQNSNIVSKKVQAKLKYFTGVCYEAIGISEDTYENFISAFKLEEENKTYIERACISYYFLNDQKYSILKEIIERTDEYNTVCWAINTFNSKDILNYIINTVPSIVLKKNHFKRIIFNYNLKNDYVDSLELLELLNVSKEFNELPNSINYDNFYHWIFILNAVSINFFTVYEIPYFEKLKRSESAIHFMEIARVLSEVIISSELDNTCNVIVFTFYWLESELDIKEDTIRNLKESYNSLKERDSFRTMLLANSIQKNESVDNALQIIEEYKGVLDEYLISLKAFCDLKYPQNEETIEEYFKIINHIDELNIYNACGYLLPVIKSKIIRKEKLLKLINEVRFSNNCYEEFIRLLIDSLYEDKIIVELERINHLKEQLLKESNLYYFVAIILFENKYFDECISFQETYIDEDKETRDLFLFLRAMDALKNQHQLRLLRLLKHWRKEFTFNEILLRIEIEFYQILKNWDEIEDISRYALSELPYEEGFYTLYINALSINKNKIDLEPEIEKIKNFNFKSTENLLRIVRNLLNSKFSEAALEILYQKALNKSDSQARINYFALSANLPSFFNELPIVTDDCFVKFEIDGEFETIHITKENKSQIIVKKSLEKKANELFTIETKFSKKIKHVRIFRIMNKYLALCDDILTEANSSFSNLPLESIKFDSNDFSSFEKILKENFGPDQEERRKHIEKVFNQYQNYEISFSELSNVIFDGCYLDTYYHLISNQSEGFLIKPLKYFNIPTIFEQKKPIIDFTSGLLFFELENKLGLKFNNLIVTKNIYELIDNLISKTESEIKSKMSLNIYKNKIVPHFYSEDYHDKRIEFLKKVRIWFTENTITEEPIEKLEMIRPLYEDGKMTFAFEYFVDNAFLSLRNDYLLITDDIGYEKMLKTNNWSTTERFLQFLYPEKMDDILEIMLSFRYVGITINTDVLYSSYINHFKDGYDHIYNYALRNISLPVNFNTNNIEIVVDFLKKLALNPTITKENYKFEAIKILSMIISSLPNTSFVLSLRNRIKDQFYLMGDFSKITLLSLLDALRISKPR